MNAREHRNLAAQLLLVVSKGMEMERPNLPEMRVVIAQAQAYATLATIPDVVEPEVVG